MMEVLLYMWLGYRWRVYFTNSLHISTEDIFSNSSIIHARDEWLWNIIPKYVTNTLEILSLARIAVINCEFSKYNTHSYARTLCLCFVFTECGFVTFTHPTAFTVPIVRAIHMWVVYVDFNMRRAFVKLNGFYNSYISSTQRVEPQFSTQMGMPRYAIVWHGLCTCRNSAAGIRLWNLYCHCRRNNDTLFIKMSGQWSLQQATGTERRTIYSA